MMTPVVKSENVITERKNTMSFGSMTPFVNASKWVMKLKLATASEIIMSQIDVNHHSARRRPLRLALALVGLAALAGCAAAGAAAGAGGVATVGAGG